MSKHDVGAKIHDLREEKGMSLTELARRSGVSRPYLHLIENGESNPSQEKLTRIAQALGVIVSELIGEFDTIEELPANIPTSLKEFAEEQNLPTGDIIMLSKINYRGQQPQTVHDWSVLYNVIKGMSSKD